MKIVKIIKKIRISFFIGTIATFLVFYFGFMLIGIDLNGALPYFVIVISLLVGLLIRHRSKWHQGQIPMFLGVLMLAIGGILFFGAFTFDYIEESTGLVVTWKSWWTLTEQQSGIMFLIAIVGIILLFVGVKQALGASYWWGNMKR